MRRRNKFLDGIINVKDLHKMKVKEAEEIRTVIRILEKSARKEVAENRIEAVLNGEFKLGKSDTRTVCKILQCMDYEFNMSYKKIEFKAITVQNLKKVERLCEILQENHEEIQWFSEIKDRNLYLYTIIYY